MLKTPKDFVYDQLNDTLMKQDYKIAANDAITFRLFTNDGFKLIDLATTNVVFSSNIDILVESDGTLKMPLLGLVHVQGLTLRETEALLEEKYSEFYVKPFISIRVSNKRVIVFPGNGGVARALPLTNNNTTVMEAIALAGGITEDGKAYKVKLIRNNRNTKPQVFLLDLSTIDGLAGGNTRVSSNDIIYVEPRYRLGRTLVTELTPIITLLTSVLLVYSLFITK
ncbi:MAG: polysaccharide biosynthesis/export family protein [Bacteroidia bacterium]